MAVRFLLVPARASAFTPLLLPGLAMTGWGGSDNNALARAAALALAWDVGRLAVSAIRVRLLRVASVALVWWSFWGALVLHDGDRRWL